MELGFPVLSRCIVATMTLVFSLKYSSGRTSLCYCMSLSVLMSVTKEPSVILCYYVLLARTFHKFCLETADFVSISENASKVNKNMIHKSSNSVPGRETFQAILPVKEQTRFVSNSCFSRTPFQITEISESKIKPYKCGCFHF